MLTPALFWSSKWPPIYLKEKSQQSKVIRRPKAKCAAKVNVSLLLSALGAQTLFFYKKQLTWGAEIRLIRTRSKWQTCYKLQIQRTIQVLDGARPDSSVGRAGDWKSPCRWFDSASGHHFPTRFLSFQNIPLFKFSTHKIDPFTRWQWDGKWWPVALTASPFDYKIHPYILPFRPCCAFWTMLPALLLRLWWLFHFRRKIRNGDQ